MDLEGFTALNDAQVKDAEAQADVALKFSQAEINWAQADHKKLENVRLWMNLQWDAQAHEHLLRTRNHALQQARTVRMEGERLRAKLHEVTWLMAGGGSFQQVRDGWIAFEYLRSHLPFTVAAKAADVQPTKDAYDIAAWRHSGDTTLVPLTQHDPGALLDWARRHTYFPVFDGAAWLWMSNFLQALDTAAGVEAAAIQARSDAAAKEAKELEERDWDRLKVSAAAAAGSDK